MRRGIAVFLAVAGCVSAASAQEHRELGPHVHGTSSVNIAVEGNALSIDLDAPGMDIVGFEHEASTPGQLATIDAAIETLKDPIALFGIPAAAGCSVTSVVAGPEEDAHEHEHEEEGADAEEEEEEGHHSDFAGEYALECATPAALTALDFSGYFSSFAGAQEVNVQFVSDTAQLAQHLDRANPRLSLTGQP